MMVVLMAALLAIAQKAPAFPEVAAISGHCQYRDELSRYVGDTIFARCNRLEVRHFEASSTFSFIEDGFGTMSFEGKQREQGLQIERIHLPSGSTVSAGGTCRLYESNGRFSVATCVGHVGGKAYAANFLAHDI